MEHHVIKILYKRVGAPVLYEIFPSRYTKIPFSDITRSFFFHFYLANFAPNVFINRVQTRQFLSSFFFTESTFTFPREARTTTVAVQDYQAISAGFPRGNAVVINARAIHWARR